jgi:hypothetical protein
MLVLKECPADKAPKINVSRYLVVNQHALKCLRMILKGRLETNSAKPSCCLSMQVHIVVKYSLYWFEGRSEHHLQA